ncbi:hypothetical protein Tco_0543791, partial [Tanacetum coccineum]
MESKFVALADACKEAKWLINLIIEISLWSKLISLISIRCDNDATLAKAYSQMYNGKSRHLGVKHIMIRELIMNGVVSIEFVSEQVGLAARKNGQSRSHLEEYIELEAKKARRHDRTFNWETATYGKVSYFGDFNYLKYFESEFLAIVYNDALTFGPEISSEPKVSPLKDDRIDFRISFDESNDEDYIVMYDKDSFSYKLISANNFKTDSEKDIDKVNLPRSDVIVQRLGDDIDANVDTESHEFNKDFKTNHDIYHESFNMKENFIIIKV